MKKINDAEKGKIWRKTANGITRVKTYLSYGMAANVVTGDRLMPKVFRYRSIGMGLLALIYGVSDKADGYCGRKAEKYGVPITKVDEELDPKLDKLGNRALMGAVVVRGIYDLVTGETENKKLLGLALAIGVGKVLRETEDRDERMNESRANAAEGASTKAININKYKTGGQNTGHTILYSPAGNYPLGVAAGLAAYSTSVILGEIGFQRAHRIHSGMSSD